MFTHLYHLALKGYIHVKLFGILPFQAKPTHPLKPLIWFLSISLILSAPILFAASPDYKDNVITRFVWYLVKIAFYGTGAAGVMIGIIRGFSNKFLNTETHGKSAVEPILWGIGLLAAPAILKLFLEFFNSKDGHPGSLDNIYIDKDFNVPVK